MCKKANKVHMQDLYAFNTCENSCQQNVDLRLTFISQLI